MRVVSRMNVGGPAVQVSTLMRRLDPTLFEQRLFVGGSDLEEGDYLELSAPDLEATTIDALGRRARRTENFRALATLAGAMREFRPDVLHTHTAKAGVLGRIAAAVHGVPIRIHTFDGLELGGYRSATRSRLAIRVERALARSNEALIAVGAHVRDDLLGAGIGRPEQFEVMPPGVSLRPSPDREQARRLLGLSGPAPVVAFVGRVTAVKRPDRMLAVAREVRRSIPDIRFLVCGDGDLLNQMVNESTTYRLNVSYLGWRADMETIYAAADLVLLTSDSEGMPVALIEAGLARRACVATDVGGVAEVVRHSVTGLVTEPDIANLSRDVKRLLLDGDLRRGMGEAAYVETSRRFGSDRFLAATTELYRRLAVRRGRWPIEAMDAATTPFVAEPVEPASSAVVAMQAGAVEDAPLPDVATPNPVGQAAAHPTSVQQGKEPRRPQGTPGPHA